MARNYLDEGLPTDSVELFLPVVVKAMVVEEPFTRCEERAHVGPGDGAKNSGIWVWTEIGTLE